MSLGVKMRCTISWTYDADPKYYVDNPGDEISPEKMAEIDEAADPEDLFSMGLESSDFNVKITPE